MSLFSRLSQNLKTRTITKRASSATPAARDAGENIKLVTARIISQAQLDAKNIVIAAKEEAVNLRSRAENRHNHWHQALSTNQENLSHKATQVAKFQALLNARQQFLDTQSQIVTDKKSNLENLKQEYLDKLLTQAHLTSAEAEAQLTSRIAKLLDQDVAQIVQEAVAQAEEDSEALLQELLTVSMPRGSVNFYQEYFPPIVRLDSQAQLEELLGPDNCNKDFLEQLAQVELLIDDQLVIKINATDSVDRELTRQTLEKLLAQGRINPALIRRIHQQVKQQLERNMLEQGRRLCKAVGVHNLSGDIMAKLGKFTYRYSYGQNMIEHTLEETLIGISLAHELGADSNVVRLGCLFHDIGKVIYDDEGTHVETGVNFLKEHNIPQAVIDCVAQSHEDEPFSSVESIIVHIADSISGARPAARHNDHEFTNRIKYLESVPLEYPGVKDAYAIQAGREVRVTVDPKKVSDQELLDLATTLRDRIKNELTYPGSVTVNVIRELVSNTTLKTGEGESKAA